jgi:colicin import membrane protein
MTQAALPFSRLRPREPGTKRAMMYSLGAHVLLAIFLTVGLSWKNSSPSGVEAELWDSSAVPKFEEAKPIEPVKEERAPTDEKAEIVSKKQKKDEPKKEVKPEKVTPKAETKPEPKPKEKPKEEKPKEKSKEKETPKDKPKEVAKEKDTVKPGSSSSNAAQDKERADRLAKLRAAAGAESGSGGTTGTGVGTGGTATPGYADRVRKKIKPFITFNPSSINGNPPVTVYVELAPDGNILNKRITKSSGIEDWDNAVMKALESAGSLPKDEEGKVPRQVNLIFKPKD